jgi:hypothetical protein
MVGRKFAFSGEASGADTASELALGRAIAADADRLEYNAETTMPATSTAATGRPNLGRRLAVSRMDWLVFLERFLAIVKTLARSLT